MSLAFAFRSGMSSKSDLRGAIDAGVPVGVVAGHLTTGQIVMTLPRYLDAGGRVFIDSGAFTTERTGDLLDWSRIIGIYETIAELTDRPANLYVVAPDKVGDQKETLELLQRHEPRLHNLLAMGVQLIVPLQRGLLPASMMLAAVQDIFKSNRFIAGIPSNKAAMSIDECRSLKHHSFHILGRVQANASQADRIDALMANNPSATTVSGDANWLRSNLAAVRHLTQTTRQAPSPSLTLDHPRVHAIKTAIMADNAWGEKPLEVLI